MTGTPEDFPAAAAAAAGDATLARALAAMQAGARVSLAELRAELPEFDALRDAAAEIKDHALAHLDHYLEVFERNATQAGGRVHWCPTASDACRTVLAICRAAGAEMAIKGKTMVAEEIGLNDFLAENGIRAVETDLGEYIVQAREEPPSHIIMPAIHLTERQIADTFRDRHADLDPGRALSSPRDILEEARARLRPAFLSARVGITGANLLIAETGSVALVTNEGNGDLTHTLPKVHIVLAGIEKVVPTLEDGFTVLRLLARSATGQRITAYTSFITGARRPGDADGPEQLHVVLLDNGRSALLDGPFRTALRCIRCGACQTHCPVYGAVGGHAYGAVYAGPLGAVLTPALQGIEAAHHLPEASTLCGRCAEVCPVRIPLPDLMRKWRERAHAARVGAARGRLATAAFGWIARHPAAWRLAGRAAAVMLHRLARGRGRLRRLPFAAAWTAGRDLPAPEGGTFLARWRAGEGRGR